MPFRPCDNHERYVGGCDACYAAEERRRAAEGEDTSPPDFIPVTIQNPRLRSQIDAYFDQRLGNSFIGSAPVTVTRNTFIFPQSWVALDADGTVTLTPVIDAPTTDEPTPPSAEAERQE